ncbi:hypothetical protein P6U16_22680 (plasmid) [Rhizobium sp. 32-5/1]|uniref:hypothetical protein n=1 Tax=Rhizobium sp. 32-5/1 TaxID=3019602 RepID=UPI00240D5D06|nr:hypothetical protein [Rhizobium sp. 32-5/1]WEZ85824.1 hypothetical protein P6U16_22680 [Rhizobium sp. 32-5/1]
MPDEYYSDSIAPRMSRWHWCVMEAAIAEGYLETLDTDAALQDLLARLPQLPDLLANYVVILKDTASGLADEIDALKSTQE